MIYTLSYFEEVEQDVIEAKHWYNKQSVGLDTRFAESIKNAILKILHNPLAYSVRYKNIRIAHPKIFPYGVHFYIDDVHSQIVIIAIVHSKRNPYFAKKGIEPF